MVDLDVRLECALLPVDGPELMSSPARLCGCRHVLHGVLCAALYAK